MVLTGYPSFTVPSIAGAALANLDAEIEEQEQHNQPVMKRPVHTTALDP